MRLETDDAVDDVDARLLELCRPGDVRLLVETCGQLDERDHLLAGLGGTDQGTDDRAVRARRPVERLLDGEHVGIVHGLVDERLDAARERLVRVLDEHVPFVDHPEDVHLALVARELGERRRDHRGGKALLEIGPVQLVQAPEAAEIERSSDRVDVLAGELELAHEQLLDLLRHGVVDLEAYHLRRAAAAAQVLLDGGAQVLGLLLLERRVGVARHPERVLADHAHAREEAIEVRGDDLFHRDETLAVRHDHEPGQEWRDLDASDPLLAASGRAHDHRQVQ